MSVVGALLLWTVSMLTLLGCGPIEDRMLDRVLRTNLSVNHSGWLHDGDLHVVLCGTGSPLPSLDRAGPCTAVMAGGHVLLVDVGTGASDNLGRWQLPRQALDGILLTHLHSDPIAELGEIAMQA